MGRELGRISKELTLDGVTREIIIVANEEVSGTRNVYTDLTAFCEGAGAEYVGEVTEDNGEYCAEWDEGIVRGLDFWMIDFAGEIDDVVNDLAHELIHQLNQK